MQLKILFITLLVTVRVHYICSHKGLPPSPLQIRLCQSDQDVQTHVSNLKSWVVPILLIKNKNENPLVKSTTMDMVKQFYENNFIANMLVVTANTCVETKKLLNRVTEREEYPTIFYLNECRLVKSHCTSITQDTLEQSFKKADKNPEIPKYTFSFDQELQSKIRSSARMEGETARRANDQMTQPSHLPTTMAKTSASFRPTGTIRQPSALASPSTIFGHVIESSYQPRDLVQASTNIRYIGAKSQPATREMPPNYGHITQAYQQTHLAQPSTRTRSIGTSTQVTDNWAWASGSSSTPYPPRSTYTTAPVTSVGVQSIRPVIAETFRYEPERPQQDRDETRDLLSIIEQNQMKDQNDDGDSTFTPTEYNQYIRFIPEWSPNKRSKFNNGSSGI